MSHRTVAAVDLGAESGRVAAARFDGARIDLDLIARFPNTPLTGDGRLRWNLDAIGDEVVSGLLELGAQDDVASVGVDGWGVDFGLYRAGSLLEQPLSYRDSGRQNAHRRAMQRWGAEPFFRASGVQVLGINSVFALLDDVENREELVRGADSMLMIPDIIHRRLSGSAVTEYTAATTTGIFDVAAGRWATTFMEQVGIPTHFLPEVVQPGSDLGPLRVEHATSGLVQTRVIVPAAHDTASAVIAIPRLTSSTMFISSGTWSLTGVLLDEPILTDAALHAHLANEGGYGGTIRLLRDIVGLWVLQECRSQWRREGMQISYDDIVADAARVPPLFAVVDLGLPEFSEAGDMPARIRSACQSAGMSVPETIGEIARVVIDSLALAYRRVLEDLQAVTGRRIDDIAVVGGGVRNVVLQRATASATGRPVTCWAGEATALGNAVVQLAALGELDGIEQMWSVVEASTAPHTYLPTREDDWDAAAARLDARRTTEHEPAPAPGLAGPA